MPSPVLVTLDFTARSHSVLRARPTCCDLCPVLLAFRGPSLNMLIFSFQCQASLVPSTDGTLLFPESLMLGWDPGPFFLHDLCSPLASWEHPAAH